jgi:hypothetical protein
MKVELEMTCHACPNQYDGKITLSHPVTNKPHVFPFYFRARHGSWSFTLAKSGEKPWLAKNPIYQKTGVGSWEGSDSLPHIAEEITKAEFTIYETIWKKAQGVAEKKHTIWLDKWMKKQESKKPLDPNWLNDLIKKQEPKKRPIGPHE